MKLLSKITLAIILLASTSANSANLDSIIGVNSVNLRVSISDGVATLFGTVDNVGESALVESYAESLTGVDLVKNRILIN